MIYIPYEATVIQQSPSLFINNILPFGVTTDDRCHNSFLFNFHILFPTNGQISLHISSRLTGCDDLQLDLYADFKDANILIIRPWIFVGEDKGNTCVVHIDDVIQIHFITFTIPALSGTVGIISIKLLVTK